MPSAFRGVFPNSGSVLHELTFEFGVRVFGSSSDFRLNVG